MRMYEIYEQLITEAKNAKHEYGCVMLNFPITKEWWDKIQSRVDDSALYTGEKKDKDRYGRTPNDETHITLLYGLHKDVSDDDIEDIVDSVAAPEIKFSKISTFDNDDFDVLKFDIKSPYLTGLNKKFKKLAHTSTYNEYHAHMTIAYLKKDSLTDEMTTNLSDEESLTIRANKIVYSKADGTKKEYTL